MLLSFRAQREICFSIFGNPEDWRLLALIRGYKGFAFDVGFSITRLPGHARSPDPYLSRFSA